jgi:3-dehydroquinate dehydratase-1
VPNIPLYNTLNIALTEPRAPAIIASVCDVLGEDQLAQVHADADVAELRVDRLLPCTDRIIDEQITRLGSIPVLATVRLHAEGGNWFGSVEERQALFGHLLPFVQGIDVELQATNLADLVEQAEGKLVVASMHDFNTTPHHLVLEARLEQALKAGADMFKVAVTANTYEELAQVAWFMERNSTEPVIAVSMGDLGAEGRLELLRLGSRATYAYVGEVPVVPGQLSLGEIAELRRLARAGLAESNQGQERG